MLRGLITLLFVAVSTAASAQHQHPPASPYSGFEQRPIKALSQQQVADLQAGRGMGLALPAELNGYPGPSHVLELAAQLHLTDAQREQVQNLFAAMKAETTPLGKKLIEQEAGLDRLFAEKTITPVALTTATSAIGTTQSALRAAHLRYHLTMTEVLTPAQVKHYAELRGYGPAQAR
jgi:Spy/CpxP family protein refolding chaperone